ncbi:hypothetical protein E1B28_011306 [Marasmius oreades]|uniref:Uncharacterized protein n=1 Tax=Marasmius oreades TaxID=181124 RepID=A0A9P7URY3_9AGAR|nr:uncharacterized protein E1B28_011306 [Marasmius oreades]KAG7089644.1 hypothetical protein E1B28_011306 [Marasmius oreades]
MVSAFLFSIVHAQTRTVTNANGQTVIIAVSTNQGALTTQTMQTIVIQQQQGPVGQPPATTGTPHLPIPYQYTTVVNGVKTVIQDTFTPTLGFPSTTIKPQVPSTGIIMDYSSWLSQYGATNAASVTCRRPSDGLSVFLMLAGSLLVCWISGLVVLMS